MKTCSFCAMLERHYKANMKMRDLGGVNARFSIALIEQTYYDYKTPAGKISYHGYRLRYCPECGANLIKKMRIWRKEE